MTASALTLRPATGADAGALRDLAALDETRPLTGPALLAERGGVPVAALSLADGRVAADPFVPTAAAVALLRVRAAHEATAAGGRVGLRHPARGDLAASPFG